LWEKYIDDVKEGLKKDREPQMCIWRDAEKNTDYHTVEKEIDWRDCELKNGDVYKIERTLMS